MDITKIFTTNDARVNFLKGIIRVAKCDTLEEEEFSFYHQAAQSLGLEETDIEELNYCWKTNEKINITFETTREKMCFFVQAIQLCWVDNVYTEIERSVMRVLAEELNISLSALEAVETWAYEGIKWNRRGDDLLELE